MLKSWSIQNFKPILDSGELQLKPVTILAGRNSSGKSSLIQSILMIAQTLSNPLPERALIPHGDMVKLGTVDDVLCKISDLRTMSVGFEFTSRDEIEYEGVKGVYEEYRINLLAAFHVDESDKRFSILEAPEAVLNSLSLKTSDLRYPILDELEISDEIRHLFAEDYPEEDIISMYAGYDEIYYELIVKKLTDDELFDFMKSTNLKAQKLMLRGKKPIYLGRFTPSYFPLESDFNPLGDLESPFDSDFKSVGDLESEDSLREIGSDEESVLNTDVETNANFPNMADDNSIKENSSFQYVVGLSHFLPESFMSIASLREENEQLFSLSIAEISQSMEQLTRFFTSQIRYLSPLRLDPDRTQRTFAPTSQMDDVGHKGEYAAVVYHYNQSALIDWYNPNTAQVEEGTLKDAMNAWVRYLEVADEVTTEEAGALGVAWKVVIKPGQPSRTLPEIGGGVNHLLPILVMGLLSPKNTLLIIEEPEVTLHPSVQARLGDFFMGLAQCGKQCLIETHSENLVSQLRYHIVQAGGMDKSDCMIYFVDQDERGAAKFEKVEISAKGNILNWPDGFFDETMLQEDKITRASVKKRAKKANNG